MKKILLCIALVLLVLVCFWLLTPKKSASNSTLPAKASSTNQPANAAKEIVTNPDTKPVPLTRPGGIDNVGWARLLDVRNVLLRENQPMEFYARVLDQSGLPVSGARMELHLTRINEGRVSSPSFLHMKMGDEQEFLTNTLYSDENGRVALNSIRGKDLTVWSVGKDGYVSDYNARGNYLLVRYGSRDRQDLNQDVTNPTKGITFQLWKNGETEKLVHLNTGITLSKENHQAWLNIVGGEVSYSPLATADFAVMETMLHPTDPDRQYDRTLRIQGLNGAKLMETADIYPYLAPDSGYVSEYRFDVLPSTGYGSHGTWDWEKNFYMVARGGKVHAGLKIGFVGGKLFFGFSGYLNPSGSRNLEPDPAKLIIDPAEIHQIDEATRVK
jgi:hypothetical protein